MVAIPLVFDPLAHVAFATPKAALSLALAAVLTGILVALVIRFRRLIWRPTPIHWGVGAMICAYSLATVFGLNVVSSLIGAPDRALGLLSVLDNVATYFGLVLLPRSRADAMKVGACVFAPVAPVVAYEVVQKVGLDPFPWASGLARDRPFSTFGNAGPLALYLGTLAAAAAVLTAHRAPDGRSAIALSGIAAAATVGALATDARAALIGLGLATAVAAVIITARTAPRLRVLVGAGLLALTVLGGVGVMFSPPGGRLRETVASIALGSREGEAFSEGSTGARLLLYEIALSQVRDHPVLGVGPDNYALAFPRYRPKGAAEILGANAMESSPHSWLLKVATDAGLLGLAALVGTIAAAVRAVRRGHRALTDAALIAGAYFIGAGIFSVSDISTSWLFWACLAAIAGSATQVTTQPDARTKPDGARSAMRRASYGLIVVSALAAGWVLLEVPAARADNRSRTLRASAKPAAAVVAATEAVGLKPWRAEYWHELGLALAASGDFRKAADVFARAVSLNPFHTTYLVNLSRAQVAEGLGSKSDALARANQSALAAIANDPNNPDAQFARALAAQASADPAAAVEASERGVTLGLPSEPSPYEIASRAYLALGRPREAERWARMGLQRFTTTGLGLSLAHALFVLGQSTEPRALLQAVLTIEPNNERALRLQAEFSPTRP